MQEEVTLSFIFQTIAAILAISAIAVIFIKIKAKNIKDK